MSAANHLQALVEALAAQGFAYRDNANITSWGVDINDLRDAVDKLEVINAQVGRIDGMALINLPGRHDLIGKKVMVVLVDG